MKIAFNIKPEKRKVFATLLIFLIFFISNIYAGIISLLSYFLLSIEVDFKFFERKRVKKADSIFSYFIISIGWIIILSLILTYYIHPVLAATQAYRRTIGWDKVVDLDKGGVEIMAEEIKRRDVSPTSIGFFIRNSLIEYESDYEIWGIMDYWATPSEIIEKGVEDCDGLAILTKAVSNYLDKDEEYKKRHNTEKINTTIEYEPSHLYTVTNGVEDNKLNTKESSWIGIFIEIWNDLPSLRKIVFLIITPLIFLRWFFGVKW